MNCPEKEHPKEHSQPYEAGKHRDEPIRYVEHAGLLRWRWERRMGETIEEMDLSSILGIKVRKVMLGRESVH
jgi:hypothetical protein